ncbi:hypothetical protein DFS34DRAFT_243101 [Phlyctochytrium arcticum]|nr:hypothetical protein DFS34DRAFT_243101 [Phlyctochytrium arcticum]
MAMERTSPVRTMQSFFQAKKAGGRAAGKVCCGCPAIKSLMPVLILPQAINSPDATKTPTRFSQRLASTPSQALSPLPAAVKASLPNSPATKRRRQNDEDIEQHAIFTPKKPKVSASTHSTPTKSLRKHVNKVDSAKGDKKASAFKLSETPNPPTSLTFEPVLSPVKANPSIAPVTPEGKQIPSAAIQSRPSLRSLRRDSTEFVKIADKEATASIQVNDDLIHDPHEFAGSPSIKDSHGQISQSKTIRILSTSTTKITSSTPTPAFQKYRHLVTPGRKLLLPTKYEMLEKMFHGLEYTVMFMKGRDQPCIYHKIRKPNSISRSIHL